MKLMEKLFAVSLSLISLTALVTTVTGFADLSLPLWALRLIGAVNLVSLPVLIYSSVQSMKEKMQSAVKKPAGGKVRKKKKKKK